MFQVIFKAIISFNLRNLVQMANSTLILLEFHQIS